jgi:hypothetical protein
MNPHHRHRFAFLAPAGKIPGVGKPGALPGLNGLDAAVAPLEEDAFVIVGAIGSRSLVGQGEAVALRAQARVPLDEIVLADFQETGDSRHFPISHKDKARPAAAVCAALALVENFGGHAKQWIADGCQRPSLLLFSGLSNRGDSALLIIMRTFGIVCAMVGLLVSGCHRPGSSETAESRAPTPVPTPDYASPGTFYLLAPVRKETKDGIVRLVPGTEVKLVRPGRYRTPEGEMALDPKLLTNDRTLARASQSADATNQRLAMPKRVESAPAAAAAPAPVTSMPAAGQKTETAAEAKVRTLKFRLAELKDEEANIQRRIDYLTGRSDRRQALFNPSTNNADLKTSLQKLEYVQGKIQQLQGELDAIPR